MIELIKKLQKAYFENPDNDNKFRLNLAIGEHTNTLERVYDKEVARRVSKKYSLDKQIDIILSGDIIAITSLKEDRAKIRAEVENEAKQIETELSAEAASLASIETDEINSNNVGNTE